MIISSRLLAITALFIGLTVQAGNIEKLEHSDGSTEYIRHISRTAEISATHYPNGTYWAEGRDRLRAKSGSTRVNLPFAEVEFKNLEREYKEGNN